MVACPRVEMAAQARSRSQGRVPAAAARGRVELVRSSASATVALLHGDEDQRGELEDADDA
jgi:hypothetical protein